MIYNENDLNISSAAEKISKEQTYSTEDITTDKPLLDRITDAYWANVEENVSIVKPIIKAGTALVDYFRDEGIDDDHNFEPLDNIEGYEKYAHEFTSCKNMRDVNRIKWQIDREHQNKQAMSEVPGGVNLTLGLISGFSDPINFIPWMNVSGKAKTISEALKEGTSMAFISNAVQEGVIMANSFDYTPEEYAINVAIGTALGGSLAGADAFVKGKPFNNAVVKNRVDNLRKSNFNDDVLNGIDKKIEKDVKLSPEEQLSTVGAKQVEEELLEGVEGFDNSLDTNNLVNIIVKAEKHLNPAMRMATSVSRRVRTIADDLFEQSFHTNGVQNINNLETTKKNITDRLMASSSDVDLAYNEFVFGNEDAGILDSIKAQTQIGIDKTKSRDVFDELVNKALETGEMPKNPSIAKAYKTMDEARKFVANKLIEMKELGYDVPGVVKNWTPRAFDSRKIASDVVGFKNKLNSFLSSKAEKIRSSGELAKNEESLIKNEESINKIEQDLKVYADEIKKINTKEFYLKQNIPTIKGDIHRAEIELDRAIRANSKIENEIISLSDDIDIPTDRDFAKQIKHGVGKDKEPWSFTKLLKNKGILIDDAKGDIASDSTLLTRNAKSLKGKKIMHLYDLSEMMEQYGYTRERHSVDEVIDLLNDEFSGYSPLFREEDMSLLERMKDIDVMREHLSRMGYNWERMTPDEINNILTDIGNKGYLRKAYVEKAQKKAFEKASKIQKENIKKSQDILEYKREQLKNAEKELEEIREELRSKRDLRDNDKLTLKITKGMNEKLRNSIEWQRSMLSALDDGNFRVLADDITNNLLGHNMGASSWDMKVSERGGLMSRDLLSGDISLLDSFIDKSSTHFYNALQKEMVDLSVLEKFGDYTGKQKLQTIDFEYSKIHDRLEIQRNKYEVGSNERSKLNKQIKSLNNEQKEVTKAFEHSLNRLRGLSNVNSRGWHPALSVLKSFSSVTSLGKVVLSSIPDYAQMALVLGMKDGAKGVSMGFKKFFTPKLFDELRNNPDLRHAFVEYAQTVRGMNYAEITDPELFGSQFVRKSKAFADVYMRCVGMNRHNGVAKAVTGLLTENKLYRIGEDLKAGKTLSEFDSKFLKRAGLTETDVVDISENMRKFGDVSGEQKHANVYKWDNLELANKFNGTMTKIMDLSVITPGMERPLFFDYPELSTIFQFKSFIFSSTSRTLIPALQNYRDANTYGAILLGTALGVAAVASKKIAAGRDVPEMNKLIVEGFKQSGVLGWTEEAYNLMDAGSRGGVSRALYASTGGILGEDMNRFQADNLMWNALGPSFGKIRDFSTVVGDITQGKFTKQDANKIKSLIPLQNSLYLEWMMRQFVEGMSK